MPPIAQSIQSRELDLIVGHKVWDDADGTELLIDTQRHVFSSKDSNSESVKA